MAKIPPESKLMDVSMSDVFDAANVINEEILDDPGNKVQDIENNEEINDETLEEIYDEASKETNDITLDEETSSTSIQDQTNNSGSGNTPRAAHDTVPVVDADSEETIVPEKKRKKHNSNAWKRNVNKKLRMTGKKYLGYRRDKSGKIYQDSPKEERKMGETCNSRACQKSKIRFCRDIDEERRLQIFDNFWTSMDWEQRRVYLADMVEKSLVKRRTKVNEEVNGEEAENESDENVTIREKDHKRNSTLKYHLVSDGKKLQVCQKMFLNTLGIKKWTIRYWISDNKQVRSAPVEEDDCTGMSLQGSPTRKTKAGTAVKKRWNYLRDGYRKCLKRKAAGESTRFPNRVWKWEKEMSFLHEHFRSKKTTQLQMASGKGEQTDKDRPMSERSVQDCDISDLDPTDDQDDLLQEETFYVKAEPILIEEPPESLRETPAKQSTVNTYTALTSSTPVVCSGGGAGQEVQVSDHLSAFFSYLEETVRRFPPLLQIEAKSKFAQVLLEFEMKNLTDQR